MNTTKLLGRFIKSLQNEAGFSTFITTLLIMVGLMFAMTLIYWPHLKVYLFHQSAQTAADAGVLAASEEWAENLTARMGLIPKLSQFGAGGVDDVTSIVPYIGDCWQFPDEVSKDAAKLHWFYYYALWIPFDQRPKNQAAQYAQLNRDHMGNFDSRYSNHTAFLPLNYTQFHTYNDDVEMWFPPVVSILKAERSEEIGGKIRQVPARAAAITYLKDIELICCLPIYEFPYCVRFGIWLDYTWSRAFVSEEMELW